jgi:IS1 family transposase
VIFVDRATRCIVGWIVSFYVSDDLLQELVDDAPQAHWYYSDALAAYQDLAYDFGIHFAMNDKSQTYSVEADNAELRHYLARKSRCFSRAIDALRAAAAVCTAVGFLDRFKPAIRGNPVVEQSSQLRTRQA